MNIYETGEYLRRFPTAGANDAAWKADQIAGLISNQDISFKTVVEVGCGSGQILAALEQRLPDTEFFGCDIAPRSEELWNELRESGSQVQFFVGDFLKSDERYDLLLLIDVFEHIPDYMGFLGAIKGRAKHHIFHIPLELSAQGVLRDVPMKTRESVGHLHYFSRTTALATLADCGYLIKDFVLTNSAFDRPKTRKAKALNFIRWPMYKLLPEFTVRLLGGWSMLVLAQEETA